MNKPNGFKETKEYKEVRKIFKEQFYPPHYTDYIKDGVSFKWTGYSNLGKLIDEIPEHLLNMMTLKINGKIITIPKKDCFL